MPFMARNSRLCIHITQCGYITLTPPSYQRPTPHAYPAERHRAAVPANAIIALSHAIALESFLANDVDTSGQGDGTHTLSFSDIAAGSAATSTGDFATILVPFESSPSHGSIPYTLGGNTTYPSTFVEFVNPNNSADDLFVQILNLDASECCQDASGGFTFNYNGNVNFFVGSLTGGVFTPNPLYSETSGTVHFTSQDERVGAVTFSGTAGVPTVAPIPEPSSIALLGTAILAGAGSLKKRLLS